MMNWIKTTDRLPDKSGWYLVYAPTYSGGSSSGLECIDGVMFSKFKIAKNGNKSWSIEVGYHQRPGCVMFWMPMPKPPCTECDDSGKCILKWKVDEEPSDLLH